MITTRLLRAPLLLGLALSISCHAGDEPLLLSANDTRLTIAAGDQPLLSYVHAETMPPAGVDPLYKRAAYIHPIFSPGGEVLTRIQPPDHYHHYGIWNPWTRTNIDGRQVDFWNLSGGQGTVRFVEYQEKFVRETEAGFSVDHDHVYFTEDDAEIVAIDETWRVTVSDVRNDRYTISFTTTLSTPLPGGITFEQYRYGGGLGYRATAKWGAGNSTVVTSSGKHRDESDATRARWVVIEGESTVPEGRSGILFMSHPGNHAHPEPVRMWSSDTTDGEGNIFFMFTPIREQAWYLAPGNEYELKYQLVVFDGSMGPGAAENYWQKFAVARKAADPGMD